MWGEPFFLRIDEVDGSKLATPCEYASTAMPLRREVPGLKVGGRFRCIGYESGRFQGLANDPSKYLEKSEISAGQPFHLALQFEVLKVKQADVATEQQK